MGDSQKLSPDEQVNSAREAFDEGQDFTIAVEEEFALLDPDTLELTNRFEELKTGAVGTELDEHLVGELIASEIEVKTGKCANFAEVAELIARRRVQLGELADVTVVPSIFPEAFGMVAAEAAAAGSPPLVARHSGLAEVAEGLEAGYPAELRHLASFATGDSADLAGKLRELLALTREARTDLGAAARRVAVERWSWSSVSERLLAVHLR